MDTRLKIVEDAHVVASFEQSIRNMGANEAGSARHQCFHKFTSFFIWILLLVKC
jgi:hypothetical protein